jgi:antitoxin component YwqK of YwqJK toxin-antitoxin module
VKKIYYDNGKLKQEINIIDGKQDGITKIYAQDGTLTEERICKAGKLLNRKQVSD